MFINVEMSGGTNFGSAVRLSGESSKSCSKTVAREAERTRRRELEEKRGIWIKRRKFPLFLDCRRRLDLSPERGSRPRPKEATRFAISQLTRDFGRQLLCDICAADIASFQNRRKRDGVSNRTVNLELGVMRSILRRHRMWEPLTDDVNFLEGESIARPSL